MVASAAASFAAQQQQANDAKKQYNEMGENARTNYNRMIGDTAAQANQDAAAASQQALQERVNAVDAQGAVNTVTAERGVTGNSVQGLLDEYSQMEARSVGDIKTNLQWGKEQQTRQLESARAGIVSQLNQAKPGRGPSPLAAALNLAGGLAQGADQMDYRMERNAYAKKVK
jgi:hypothetical protein